MAECVATRETDDSEWILCPHHCTSIDGKPGFVAVVLDPDAKTQVFDFLTREEAILFLESSGIRFKEYYFEVDLQDAVSGGGIHPWRF